MICGVGMMFLSYSAPPAHSQQEARPTAFNSKERHGIRRVPVIEEEVTGELRRTGIVDFFTLGSQVWEGQQLLIPLAPHPATLNYVHRQLSPHILDSVPDEGQERTKVGTLQEVGEFFHFLKTPPEAVCQKLVILGGCSILSSIPSDITEGSKMVCLDPMLELPPGNDSTSCLTLSFGIFLDASFDEAMSDMNCEVHMFDMLNFSPTKLLNKSSHVQFHQVGLAKERQQQYYLNIKREIPVDSLVGILLNNSLIARPIHVLKVDIEGNEWSVFKELIKEPILDIIGQLAIEIHSEGLLDLPVTDHLAYIQRHYDILRGLEDRGFKKLAYWDNNLSKKFTDTSGTSHFICGEIHYVNSKWYNSTFKKNLKNLGLKFK
ncbi:hypothetical protein Pcinc_021253 [Petrolisthes cinctipes]|uniref:Methyltransferase domain-containing protein n=1 Tax=Petrolisthes cinctipes TaxID=88211 RepID=A0AAE1FHR9_PETCI|nr:hypothetical protein Pcinc_021253 [Petrolisthes cinctipes]